MGVMDNRIIIDGGRRGHNRSLHGQPLDDGVKVVWGGGKSSGSYNGRREKGEVVQYDGQVIAIASYLVRDVSHIM